MTHDAPSSFYSSPEILSLPQLLEGLHSGELLVPKFQRPLVWPREMRLAVLDSVLEGIPIGAVLVWRTTLTNVRVKESVGPFRLPKKNDAKLHQYLLDGQQRLTTLYSALFDLVRIDPEPRAMSGSSREDDAPEDYETYFNLKQGGFVVRSQIEHVEAFHLPLVDVLAGKRLTRFQRRLEEALKDTMSPPTIDALKDRADEVADAFRQYKLPVIPITSDSIETVTKTFERVNSQHVTMSEPHMINALVHLDDFDFLDRVDAIRNDKLMEIGWSDIEEQTILRICKIELDLAVYEVQADALSKRLKEDTSALERVARYLLEAASFFDETMKIRSPGLVPYPAQIVLVAAAFRSKPNMQDEARSSLANWIRLTTYSEVFARQMSESRFQRLHEEVRAIASGRRPSPSVRNQIRRPLGRFDFRHARSRLLAIMLAGKKPVDPVGESEWRRPLTQLARLGVAVVPQLVSARMAPETVSTSPGARVVLPRESVQSLRNVLRKPSTYEGDFERLLRSHLITPLAQRAFAREDYARFVELREKEMNRIEEERFNACLKDVYGEPA